MYVKFVYEGPGQQQPAARLTQKVVRRERIRQRLKIESGSFVADGNDELAGGALHAKMNFLVLVIAIAVDDGVNDAFANRDSHLMPDLIVEAELARFPQHKLFGFVHALKVGVEFRFVFLRIAFARARFRTFGHNIGSVSGCAAYLSFE